MNDLRGNLASFRADNVSVFLAFHISLECGIRDGWFAVVIFLCVANKVNFFLLRLKIIGM